MPHHAPPSSDIDLYSDAALDEPFELYRQLRDCGAAVRLTRNDVHFIGRHEHVRGALRNWQQFSSAQGVGSNPFLNQAQQGSMLASDPPQHDALRAVVGRPLSPQSVRGLTDRIVDEAERLADRLLSQGSFDAVSDLAWHLPMTVVSHLVGVPESVRQELPSWSSAAFDASGPLNARTEQAMPTMGRFVGFLSDPGLRDHLASGGWGAQLYEAADRGEVPHERCAAMLADYLAPSLDTTASAIGSAIALFAHLPAQWDAIRADASLIPNAVLEVIRLETPIPGFTRVVTNDMELEGCELKAGARVLLSYASANRDERKWDGPNEFDVRRNAAEHLGFGHGTHTCMGMHLAQLEIRSLLAALAKRIQRFELQHAQRALNNGLRSWGHLKVRVH